MHSDLVVLYTHRTEQFVQQKEALKRKLGAFSLFRLMCFCAAIGFPIYFYSINIRLAWSGGLIFFTLFLAGVKRYQYWTRKLQLLTNYIEINQSELEYLKGDFKNFDDGSVFSDPMHAYSFDLDLFGPGSLFNRINRTCTLGGKELLSCYLSVPETSPEVILSRQNAIRELTDKIELRQSFAAHGMQTAESRQDVEQVQKDESALFGILKNPVLRVVSVLLSVMTPLVLLLWIFGFPLKILFWSSVLVQWVILGLFSKSLMSIQQQFGKRSGILQKYTSLINLINSEEYTSELLLNIQKKIRKDGLAEKHIHELERIIAAFDMGSTQIGLLVFNSLFMWNMRYAIRLQRWYARYGKEIPCWFESIAHFDALSSLATYAFNNPEYIYPIPVENKGHFSVQAQGVGHPFITAERCVCNDFSLGGEERFVIVTGANMAGKSTFLRTVGINLVMGMSGLPVFARNMIFTPIALYTNMRTTDSLVNEESYFFAELKRLRHLLDLLEQGIPLFVILDEILRGTNSIDKLSGSRGFVSRLMNYPCSGLIATHDLKLTEIAAKYEGRILTECFEIQLSEAGLHFDYLLTPGVTQTMNATFLMKKMGIIDSEN